ncbi:hypothetical protein EXU48_11160 [Occultella glacieicola]|uniref:Uncharacterized protein n=1 Tax=Occultella glacieicola TaxID=2518684 RepID=A0ABY2E591_9MICO|nr:hypothetical protein [Occultella glacieicola]TDE94012.1 hypothetical protein EXU48_11160 [Occultella glacieicola]
MTVRDRRGDGGRAVAGSGATQAVRTAHAALLGAVCGLAWAASLRALMAELAAPSRMDWFGTFGGILLPGAAVGALLASAWARGAAGRANRIGWFALAPLAFAITLGPGQLAFAALTIAGGYALGAHGRGWLRIACAILGAAFLIALVVSLPLVGGASYALTEPRGAWLAVLGASLTILIMVAEAIPFRYASRPSVGPGPRS